MRLDEDEKQDNNDDEHKDCCAKNEEPKAKRRRKLLDVFEWMSHGGWKSQKAKTRGSNSIEDARRWLTI
jgi:hypothetical protein